VHIFRGNMASLHRGPIYGPRCESAGQPPCAICKPPSARPRQFSARRETRQGARLTRPAEAEIRITFAMDRGPFRSRPRHEIFQEAHTGTPTYFRFFGKWLMRTWRSAKKPPSIRRQSRRANARKAQALVPNTSNKAIFPGARLFSNVSNRRANTPSNAFWLAGHCGGGRIESRSRGDLIPRFCSSFLPFFSFFFSAARPYDQRHPDGSSLADLTGDFRRRPRPCFGRTRWCSPIKAATTCRSSRAAFPNMIFMAHPAERE